MRDPKDELRNDLLNYSDILRNKLGLSAFYSGVFMSCVNIGLITTSNSSMQIKYWWGLGAAFFLFSIIVSSLSLDSVSPPSITSLLTKTYRVAYILGLMMYVPILYNLLYV